MLWLVSLNCDSFCWHETAADMNCQNSTTEADVQSYSPFIPLRRVLVQTCVATLAQFNVTHKVLMTPKVPMTHKVPITDWNKY